MLPQEAEITSPTIPSPAAVADLLAEYATGLDSVLEETPKHYAGTPYLPTRRALLATEIARNLLAASAGALSYAGAFAAPVRVPGVWSRPVDLLADALRQLETARHALDTHQSAVATPLDDRAGLFFLAEWVRIVEEDLAERLAPVVDLLGRVAS